MVVARTLEWSSRRTTSSSGRDSRLSVQTRSAGGGALSVIGRLAGDLTISFNIVLLVMILIIALGLFIAAYSSLAVVALAALGWGVTVVYLDTTGLIARSLSRACAPVSCRIFPHTARPRSPRPGARLGILDPETGG